MKELHEGSAGSLCDVGNVVEHALRWASTARDKRSMQQLSVVDYTRKLLECYAKLEGNEGALSDANVKLVLGTHHHIEAAGAFISSFDVENSFMSMPDLTCHVATLDGLFFAPETFLHVCIAAVKSRSQAWLAQWSAQLSQAAEDCLSKLS